MKTANSTVGTMPKDIGLRDWRGGIPAITEPTRIEYEQRRQHPFFMDDVAHLEQRADELLIGNVDAKTFRLYGTILPEIGCLRLGIWPNVYNEKTGKPLKGIRPLFVKRAIYEKVFAAAACA